MTFRIEVERANGETFWLGERLAGGKRGAPQEWRYPETADGVAERLHFQYASTENFARFSVIEDNGTTYSDWEC